MTRVDLRNTSFCEVSEEEEWTLLEENKEGQPGRQEQGLGKSSEEKVSGRRTEQVSEVAGISRRIKT